VTHVVVDASVAVKWILNEQWTTEATVLLRTWTREGVNIVVPAWFMCEVSNVLYQRLHNQEIRLVDAQDNLRDLIRVVTLSAFDPSLAPKAMELAQTFALPKTYDCLYLALSERIGCELWTADEHFCAAVSAAHPQVKWIGELTIPEGITSFTE
jgi:predicted nucleic acid-binding protein